MKNKVVYKTSGFPFFVMGILMFYSLKSISQPVNFVPNHSFEDTVFCNMSGAPPVNNWVAIYGSPDYFNEIMTTCSFANNGFNNLAGYQVALEGNAYMGFGFCKASICGTVFREAIQTQLPDTLILNKKYCVSFNINKANNSKYSSDDIGFYFSLSNSVPFPAPAQYYNPSGNIISDTMNWTFIKNIYTAIGNERFLNIGNFKSDANTTMVLDYPGGSYSETYYFIDNVSIYELPEIDAGINDSVYIGNNVQLNASCTGCWSGLQYRWFPSTGLNDTTILNPIAQPTQTTTYYFGLVDTSGTIPCMVDYVDSVTVYITGVGINEYEKGHYSRLYPNPANNIVHYEIELEANETGFIQIFDLLGNLISERRLSSGVVNRTEFDFSDLSSGLYIYKLNVNGEMKVSDKLILTK
jgi:hypothetical protein